MKKRVLEFPDASVGELLDERFKRLPKVADACGQVIISGRPKLILRLAEGATEHLSFLNLLPPDALYGIHLGSARLTEVGLVSLSCLTGLRFIDLSNTGINDDGFLAILNCLPRLRSISFGGTRVTDFGLRDMPSSSLMRAFQSSGRKVKVGNKGAHSIGDKMPQLLRVTLSRTDITDEGVRGINHLTLRSLNIGMNRVTDVGIAHLAGMTSLRRLSVHDTLISDGALYFVQALKKLEFLDLSGTAIGPEGLRWLGELPKLQVLLANGLKISEKSLTVLETMSQLRVLSLGSQSDLELIKRLRYKLTSCEVIAPAGG